MVTIRPRIKYYKKKCENPSECLECVKICPEAVFAYRPSEYPEGPEQPTKWTIVPTFRLLCTYPTCKLCIEACPKDALKISIPSG